MDAVEFLKEAKRAKEYYEGFWSVEQLLGNPEWSVQQIEYFSKEHPRKTRLQDFLEKYPNAILTQDGLKMPMVCARELGYCEHCPPCKYCKPDCYSCWNEPVED